MMLTSKTRSHGRSVVCEFAFLGWLLFGEKQEISLDENSNILVRCSWLCLSLVLQIILH